MKLRARIALISAAALVPLIMGLALVARSLRAQVIEEGFVPYAHATAAAARTACEAEPRRFGGPIAADARIAAMPGLEIYAYDDDLQANHPSAPALSPAMVASIQSGEPHASRFAGALEVLVRTDTGPCAYLLVRRPLTRPVAAIPGVIALVCALLVLGVVLALLGPIVRRIHRLRDEVRASAGAGYRHAITIRGDDELTELAAAFADSGRQIAGHIAAQERRERTLREFLANTTHDVMMPLTVLQGHLTALHARSAAPDSATIRAAMQEADYIASLVHNLEIAARLEAGEPELARDPVELSSVIARITSRHGPLARRRGIGLVHAVPARSPVVLGDLTLIEQAVGNLVQNAVLHNREGGHVAAVLELDDARTFRISIKDDGPGITPDELARVLARGERGDSARTRHPHGKGLGLAIARRVAAAHEWRFDIHPGEDGGLEVELRGAVAQ